MRKFVTSLLLAAAVAVPASSAFAQDLGWSVTVGPRGVIGASVGVAPMVVGSPGYPAYPAYPAYPVQAGYPVGQARAYPPVAYPPVAYPPVAYPPVAYPAYPAPVYPAAAYLPPPRHYYRPAPVVVLPPPAYYGYGYGYRPHGRHGHHGWR